MTWAPAYATAADLRYFMRVDPVDSNDADDVAIDTAIYDPACEAASRLIDTAAGRQFGNSDAGETPTAEDRDYTPWYSPHAAKWYIDIDDLMDDSDLAVEQADATVTDYTLLPANNPQKGKPWTMMEVPASGVVTVTAHWGWTAVPDAIVNATLLQASRLVKRRDAPFGVAGSPDMGNELRLLAKIDVDVELIIRAYRRYW